MRVTYADVIAAAQRIEQYLPATPSWSYPLLDEHVGASVVVKHENVQPTGAFKVRGGVNLALSMDGSSAQGWVTASTGNHAQSVAYGARLAGLRAVIVVPTSSPEAKVAAVRALGAQVLTHGPTMTEALVRAREVAREEGLRYVDPGNEPAVVSGHATVYLELLRDHPDVQAIYVPVGSGTGAAGACIVRDALAPECRVIGVQSSAAPAAYDSWRSGVIERAVNRTRHSGLATGAGFDLPQELLHDRLDDFLLLDDEQIGAAIPVLVRCSHTLAEGAGAAALAGALSDRDRPDRIAVVCSGGNPSAEDLATLSAS